MYIIKEKHMNLKDSGKVKGGEDGIKMMQIWYIYMK